MDFSKAFDKVDHHKIIHKLKNMGVNPRITTWIKDFLHNRSQMVLVKRKVSYSLPVLSGVVGPSLFLAYINNLPGSVRYGTPNLPYRFIFWFVVLKWHVVLHKG